LAVYRASPFERAWMVKRGVLATDAKRLIADLSIGQGAMPRALSLSRAYVDGKAKQSQDMHPKKSERVIAFARLMHPIDLMDSREGQALVLAKLSRLQSGAYA
jgi:uncharacterized protein (DUF2384 family)